MCPSTRKYIIFKLEIGYHASNENCQIVWNHTVLQRPEISTLHRVVVLLLLAHPLEICTIFHLLGKLARVTHTTSSTVTKLKIWFTWLDNKIYQRVGDCVRKAGGKKSYGRSRRESKHRSRSLPYPLSPPNFCLLFPADFFSTNGHPHNEMRKIKK
jgi:hypothetical protein